MSHEHRHAPKTPQQAAAEATHRWRSDEESDVWPYSGADYCLACGVKRFYPDPRMRVTRVYQPCGEPSNQEFPTTTIYIPPTRK